MNKAYNPIDWKNEPNTSTPINETNLNKMDRAIDTIDDRVIDLDNRKANIENQTFVGTTKFRSSSANPYGINIEEGSVSHSTPTESSKFNSFGVYSEGLRTGEKAQYTKDGISMSKYGKTTTVKPNGIESGGDVTTVNGASLDGLKNDLGGVRFGIDENGNYGYIKNGTDVVIPFSNTTPSIVNPKVYYIGGVTQRNTEVGTLSLTLEKGRYIAFFSSFLTIGGILEPVITISKDAISECNDTASKVSNGIYYKAILFEVSNDGETIECTIKGNNDTYCHNSILIFKIENVVTQSIESIANNCEGDDTAANITFNMAASETALIISQSFDSLVDRDPNPSFSITSSAMQRNAMNEYVTGGFTNATNATLVFNDSEKATSITASIVKQASGTGFGNAVTAIKLIS